VKRELRVFDETLGIGVYKVFRIGKVATEGEGEVLYGVPRRLFTSRRGEILPSCIDMCVL
jgi:hypothetical protein